METFWTTRESGGPFETKKFDLFWRKKFSNQCKITQSILHSDGGIRSDAIKENRPDTELPHTTYCEIGEHLSNLNQVEKLENMHMDLCKG